MFRFVATMNPGGDYGTKELSPILKNRFSEVWCPSLASSEDLLAIVARSLAPGLQDLAERIVKLCTWLRESGAGLTVSVRDVLAWVTFINTVVEGGLAREVGVLQGAHLVWLDGLRVEGVSEVQARDSQAFVKRCREQLGAGEVEVEEGAYIETRDLVSVGPFYIARSPGPGGQEQEFSFLAPTTCSNVAKMLRALQISKPLLLDVSIGIGKTSLVGPSQPGSVSPWSGSTSATRPTSATCSARTCRWREELRASSAGSPDPSWRPWSGAIGSC